MALRPTKPPKDAAAPTVKREDIDLIVRVEIYTSVASSLISFYR
jgi:hypothetical protein